MTLRHKCLSRHTGKHFCLKSPAPRLTAPSCRFSSPCRPRSAAGTPTAPASRSRARTPRAQVARDARLGGSSGGVPASPGTRRGCDWRLRELLQATRLHLISIKSGMDSREAGARDDPAAGSGRGGPFGPGNAARRQSEAAVARTDYGRLCRLRGLTRQTCPGPPRRGADFQECFRFDLRQHSCSESIFTREAS